MIVQYTVGLPSTNAEYDASVLFLSIGAITTVSSILTATLLVREYVMVIINELKSIAARDKLTDILNRRGFEEYLPEIMDYAREGGAEVGLIVIDIDHFKAVNDTYGHGFGDDVIIALGHMLSAHKGDDGLAVRLGGEEFLLAVPVQSLDEACALAELIRQRWSRQSHYFQSSEVRCTASFGVSLLREAESVSAAISRADQALYGAKQTGRNKVQSEADLQVAKLNYVAAQMQMANQGKFAMDADSGPVTKKKR